MDKQLITEAIKAVELLDIHLYSSYIKREEYTDFDHTIEPKEQSRLNVSATIYKTSDDKATKEAERIISAKVTFGHRFIDDDENPLSEIEAVFIATYQQETELSEEATNEFLTHNVVHNVWPFWREHAFRAANEARLPKPSIGLRKPNKTDPASTPADQPTFD